jgi:general secretion pathway protein E
LNLLGLTKDKAAGANICKPVGCNLCNQKGYLGRTIIGELLIMDDEIRSLIMQKKDGASIRKAAISKGMKTFRDHGIQKVLAGSTSIEELLSNTQLDL